MRTAPVSLGHKLIRGFGLGLGFILLLAGCTTQPSGTPSPTTQATVDTNIFIPGGAGRDHVDFDRSLYPAEDEDETAPSRSYGGGADPWGLIIAEASERFDVPEQWIRAVIHHESGGRAFVNGRPLRGPGGTIGLMQLTRDTFKAMSEKYGLGPDPGDPYDNVMAGTALIREMYEEFGSPYFLAAYNCGQRCAALAAAGKQKLPSGTQKYLASLSRTLKSASPERPEWSVAELATGARMPTLRAPTVETSSAEAKPKAPAKKPASRKATATCGSKSKKDPCPPSVKAKAKKS